MKLDVLDKRNVYFVGDLHGDWKALDFFLKQVKFNYRDVIISVGDLFDRGSKNLEVLNFFLFTENAYAVRGNHEDMAIQGVVHGDNQWAMCWMQNGGDWMLDYPQEMLEGILRQVEKQFPFAIEVNHGNYKIGVTHAECPTEHWQDYYGQAGKFYKWDKDAIWGRRNVKGNGLSEVKGVHATIHGHSVRSKVVTVGNQYWIDTGSVFDAGSGEYGLTVLEFEPSDGTFTTHRVERDCFEPGGLKLR